MTFMLIFIIMKHDCLTKSLWWSVRWWITNGWLLSWWWTVHLRFANYRWWLAWYLERIFNEQPNVLSFTFVLSFVSIIYLSVLLLSLNKNLLIVQHKSSGLSFGQVRWIALATILIKAYYATISLFLTCS